MVCDKELDCLPSNYLLAGIKFWFFNILKFNHIHHHIYIYIYIYIKKNTGAEKDEEENEDESEEAKLFDVQPNMIEN